ncbi:MOSC domain-containing protein [Zoogloea sp.]|uniref:MOSC domain-containing protein n=1 Tax=Zoogloea sp. TaxID=49181 RepID=UPI001416AAA4|nr:MAG: MOSC domain-containing protein [Zoogloea sp.]
MTLLQPVLDALYHYPVKSMAGLRLDKAVLTPQGLPFDRCWMVADARGRFVTGREYPELVLVRANPAADGLTLSAAGRPGLFVPNTAFNRPVDATVWGDAFQAWEGAAEADAWISGFIGAPLKLLWTGIDTTRRVCTESQVPLSFADGFPLLLIGQASLDDLCARIGRPLAMTRFRPNLVVSGAPPYAEDSWTRIRIGDAVLRIVKPCERCVFTTVDPDTGTRGLDQEPLRTLATYRRTPDGVIFGQNLVADTASVLVPGMPVEILEARD